MHGVGGDMSGRALGGSHGSSNTTTTEYNVQGLGGDMSSGALGGNSGSNTTTTTTDYNMHGLGGDMSGGELGGSHDSSSTTRTVTTTQRVIGSGGRFFSADSSDDGGPHTVTRVTTRSGGDGGLGVQNRSTRQTVTRTMRSGFDSSSGSGSSGENVGIDSDGSSSQMVISGEDGSGVQFERTVGGGTQMRVIRHVETTYVGGTPVMQSSNVEFPDGENQEGEQEDAQEAKHSTMQDSGITLDTPDTSPTHGARHGGAVQFPKSVELSNQASVQGGRARKVVVTETRIERQMTDGGSNGGPLRSIMKKDGETIKPKKVNVKKEISFSEDVVGG